MWSINASVRHQDVVEPSTPSHPLTCTITQYLSGGSLFARQFAGPVDQPDVFRPINYRDVAKEGVTC